MKMREGEDRPVLNKQYASMNYYKSFIVIFGNFGFELLGQLGLVD